MLYAILCYNSEEAMSSWTHEQDDRIMRDLAAVQEKLVAGQDGPVARLLPTTAATTLRKGRETMVIDGPFAETKNSCWLRVDCASPTRRGCRTLAQANPGTGAFELRPIAHFISRLARAIRLIDAALTSARPHAIGALRYFRDLIPLKKGSRTPV